MTQFSAKAAIPYAELTDAPNMQSYAQGLSAVLDQCVVAKYNTVSDRNTANPAPTGGDMCYCGDTDIVYVYSTSAANWISLMPKVVYKTADTTRTSTTTQTADPHITISVEASSSYCYTVGLMFNVAAAAPGIRYGFGIPSGANISMSSFAPSTTASAFNGSDSTLNYNSNKLASSSATVGSSSSLPNSGFAYTAMADGILTTTTAGTFALTWAQQASSGSGTTLYTGSFMEITKFA